MTTKLSCSDYGFECDFMISGDRNLELIKKLRDHFDAEHGIDYPIEAIVQMLVNKGYTRDSIMLN